MVRPTTTHLTHRGAFHSHPAAFPRLQPATYHPRITLLTHLYPRQISTCPQATTPYLHYHHYHHPPNPKTSTCLSDALSIATTSCHTSTTKTSRLLHHRFLHAHFIHHNRDKAHDRDHHHSPRTQGPCCNRRPSYDRRSQLTPQHPLQLTYPHPLRPLHPHQPRLMHPRLPRLMHQRPP